jgi:hypothetical protein
MCLYSLGRLVTVCMRISSSTHLFNTVLAVVDTQKAMRIAQWKAESHTKCDCSAVHARTNTLSSYKHCIFCIICTFIYCVDTLHISAAAVRV